MLTIHYAIRETAEYGKGIFTLENIPSGTCIWSYQLNENVVEFDAEDSAAYLARLPTLADQQHFLNVTFGKGDVLCLILDDGKYMNHAESTDPRCNCKTALQSGHCYAVRDIKAGEQLFEDYATFSHPAFLFPLLEKYECAPDYYQMPIQEN